MEYIRKLDASGKARLCILDNVERSLLCHTCYLGFDQFDCTDCDNWNIIPHSCHSRFCNACGVKYQKILAANAQAMCVDVHNRHIVFTTTKNRMCLTECMNYQNSIRNSNEHLLKEKPIYNTN